MQTRIVPGAESVAEFSNKMFGVLMLHGFSSTPAEFNSMIKRCIREKFSYSVPRYPGHGTSIEDMTASRAANWYQCAREACIELSSHCDRIYIVGHSIGACFAVRLANEFNPEKVVLISMPFKPDFSSMFMFSLLAPFVKIYKKSVKAGAEDEAAEMNHTGYAEGLPVRQHADFGLTVFRNRRNLKKFHSDVLILSSEDENEDNSPELIAESIRSIRKNIHFFPGGTGQSESVQKQLAETVFSFFKS